MAAPASKALRALVLLVVLSVIQLQSVAVADGECTQAAARAAPFAPLGLLLGAGWWLVALALLAGTQRVLLPVLPPGLTRTPPVSPSAAHCCRADHATAAQDPRHAAHQADESLSVDSMDGRIQKMKV